MPPPEVDNTFQRLEATERSLYTTHARTVGSGEGPARPVRMKRGAQPDFPGLTPLQAIAWRVFKDRARRSDAVNPTLEDDLLKAHIRLRADEYTAYVLFLTWFILLPVGVVLAGVVYLVLGVLAGLGVLAIALGVVLGIVVVVMGHLALKSAPSSRARARGKKIDLKISSSMSFISAMASADVNIDAIFKELSKQKIYGEVAEEAAWITRDTELLGVDILTAIKDGAARTPSKRFQDFLQGVVTTATSGGQLKPYFLLKAEQYERENKLEMLKRVETLGLLAEVFVTTVVAFPLFLVIMLSIFAIIGNYGATVITFLWAIVGGFIPMGEIGFIIFMYLIMNEGG
jgi:flagellar protein FlaJ